MTPFHALCPKVAEEEIRSAAVFGSDGLPNDQYAFLEYYCEEPDCDCRRAFIEVRGSREPERVLVSINFGWESPAFYRRKMPFLKGAVREITEGSLDPMNRQSEYAPKLLELFQTVVADAAHMARLKRHYKRFKSALAALG